MKSITLAHDLDGPGLTKLTGDMAQIFAQAPLVLETLTGMKVGELVKRAPGMGGVSSQTLPETRASEQVVDVSVDQ